MHDRREEQEEFHSGENIAQTHPSANAKGQEIRWNLNFSFGINKSTWSEFLWLIPERWIHVNAVNQWNDMWAGWNFVTVELFVTVSKKKRSKINTNKSSRNAIHRFKAIFSLSFFSKDLNERTRNVIWNLRRSSLYSYYRFENVVMKKNLKTHMIDGLFGSTNSHRLLYHSEKYTQQQKTNVKTYQTSESVLSLSLTSLKIYISSLGERKERKEKKEKILVYVEEYLQEVPFGAC